MATPELVPLPPSESIHPRGLLEALAAIEQSATNERQGCQIPEGFLTTRQRIEFMEVGMRSAIASGLVLSLFSPLAVAMLEGRIPVFGSTTPQLCDRLLVLLLTCGFSLGYALIIGRAAWQWQGLTVAPSVNYVGSRWATSTYTERLPGYLTADLNFSYAGKARWGGWELGLSVLNVFDRRYIGQISTSEINTASNGAIYYPGAPRTVVGKVKLTF